MRRFLRTMRRLLVGLGVVLLLILAGLAGTIWLTLPNADQTAAIPGLSAPVTIRFDADGIPRIKAASELDGAAALGFVHARDRMFQMDMMRRNASGRLSEIAGPVTLPLDRQMRVLGLRRRAAADLDALPADTRAVLDAYARGVNAWISAEGRLSAPEFVVLGTPEPWTPVDSLLWGKTMGLWLSENWHTELGRLAVAGRMPQERIDELWPPDHQAGRVDASLAPDRRVAEAAADLLTHLPRFGQSPIGPFIQPQTASNEWAVDGNHTATGAPLLAGDPHLGFSLPGIWYLARIETPAGVLVGATAPGVPFLVIGHNSHVAWTFTTTGSDTQDVFIETPVGDSTYQTPDGPRPFLLHEERIGVRGQPDEVLTVRETRHGPVISDLRAAHDAVLAVSMANLAPGDTAAAGLLALNRAADIEDIHRAATLITSPMQNLLGADRQRIGLFLTGRVPVRRSGDGAMPAEGADGSHDWIGWVSGDDLPHSLAPASGRLVNANERIAPPDFPVFMGRDWFGDWRAQRIRALLDASNRHTVADFTAIQMDTVSRFVPLVLPAMLAGAPGGAGRAAKAAALLQGWDGHITADAPQPLIFNAWLQAFRDRVLAHAQVPLAAAGPMHEFVAFVLSPAGAHWCDGDCGPMLAQALQDAVEGPAGDPGSGLAARFGDDPSAWRWGEAHQAVFAHPILGRVPVVGPFATASISTPGDDTTVDRGGLRWRGFDSVEGPSYRGVYDLADLDRSTFVVAPGQSGNLASSHARDFLARWRDGAPITIGPDPASVSATIRLTP